MEDKIEVGEYVRTKEGYIAKCEDFYEDYYFFDETVERRNGESFESIYIDDINKKIVKHSKNVIKLIKEGDYVNGMEVYKGKTASGKEELLVGNHIINGMALELVNIKSIITKEQFESTKYEIKKDEEI